MNATFLLVTTAWLAGADAPPPPAAKPAPAVVAPAAAPAHGQSCCGGDCGNSCDDCCKPSFFDKLRARFHHHHDDCCECATTSCAKSACTTQSCGCETDCGCKRKWFSWFSAWRHRHDCDCCDSCGASAPATHLPPKGEPIQAPKDIKAMPSGDKKTAAPAVLEPAPKASLNAEPEIKNPFELNRRYEARVGHAPDYSNLTGQLFFVHADGGFWVLRYAPLSQEDRNGGSMVLARDLRMDNYREGDLVAVHGEILSQRSSVFLGGPLYRAQSIQLIDRDQK